MPWRESKPQDVDYDQIPPRSKNVCFTSRDFIFQTGRVRVKKEFVQCSLKSPPETSSRSFTVFSPSHVAGVARNTVSLVANSESLLNFLDLSRMNAQGF